MHDAWAYLREQNPQEVLKQYQYQKASGCYKGIPTYETTRQLEKKHSYFDCTHIWSNHDPDSTNNKQSKCSNIPDEPGNNLITSVPDDKHERLQPSPDCLLGAGHLVFGVLSHLLQERQNAWGKTKWRASSHKKLFPSTTQCSLWSSLVMFSLKNFNNKPNLILISWEQCKEMNWAIFTLWKPYDPKPGSSSLNLVLIDKGQWLLSPWQVWTNLAEGLQEMSTTTFLPQKTDSQTNGQKKRLTVHQTTTHHHMLLTKISISTGQ